MIGSTSYTQSGVRIIGGITYSSISGDEFAESLVEGTDIDVNTESIMGLRFGAEKTLANGLIAGATYSQRGVSFSASESINIEAVNANISIDADIKFAYLTGYVLNPFPFKEGIDLLAGAEIGYFRNLEMKSKIKYCLNGDCDKDTDKEEVDADDWDDGGGNMIDYGIVFGGRYAINEQMSLVGTYYFGLGEGTDEISDKHRGFQINISYALQ